MFNMTTGLQLKLDRNFWQWYYVVILIIYICSYISIYSYICILFIIVIFPIKFEEKKLIIDETRKKFIVGEPRSGKNGPARLESYHNLTENVVKQRQCWVSPSEWEYRGPIYYPSPISLSFPQTPVTHLWRLWFCKYQWAALMVIFIRRYICSFAP